jgi:hypothetical protein
LQCTDTRDKYGSSQNIPLKSVGHAYANTAKEWKDGWPGVYLNYTIAEFSSWNNAVQMAGFHQETPVGKPAEETR